MRNLAAPDEPDDLSGYTSPTAGMDLGKVVRQSALPVIGGALGAAAGTLAAPFTAGIANPVTGAMVGSAAGEMANQKLGITDPSLLNVGMSAAAPMLGPTLRAGVSSLPGASAGLQAFVMSKLGPRGVALLDKIRPPVPSGPLFERVMAAGAGVKVGTANLAAAVAKTNTELALLPSALRPNVQRLIDGVEEFTRGSGPQAFQPPAGVKALAAGATQATQMTGTPAAGAGTVFTSFERFRAVHSALGAETKAIIAQGGQGAGIAKQLYKAAWADMEAATANAQGPTGDLLREAVSVRKAEEGVDLLKRLIDTGFSRKVGNPEVNVDTIMSRIDKNRDILRKFLPDGDVQGILDTLQQFVRIPVSTKGAQAGVQGITASQRLTVGALVSGASSLLGAGPIPALTSGAGAVVGVELLSHALSSAPGRLMVKQMAAHGAGLDQVMNAMGQSAVSGVGLRGEGSQDMSGYSPMSTQVTQ